MNIKEKITQTYNKSASLWHDTRISSLTPGIDPKKIKQNRPHLFIEKPAMSAKVPNLEGERVLCLGCGSGEECGFLLSKNPKELVGIDISEKLIEIAKKDFPGVDFRTMDAENLQFDAGYFDYIYSSLVFDYFETWKKLLSGINRVLKSGGTLLFSDIHPIKWAAEKINDADGKAIGSLLGSSRNEGGKQVIYGDYLNTVLHEEVWMGEMEIAFYTKSISTMFKELYSAGFEIVDIVEPKAIEEAIELDCDYWAVNQKIPNFVIFECIKR